MNPVAWSELLKLARANGWDTRPARTFVAYGQVFTKEFDDHQLEMTLDYNAAGSLLYLRLRERKIIDDPTAPEHMQGQEIFTGIYTANPTTKNKRNAAVAMIVADDPITQGRHLNGD